MRAATILWFLRSWPSSLEFSGKSTQSHVPGIIDSPGERRDYIRDADLLSMGSA